MADGDSAKAELQLTKGRYNVPEISIGSGVHASVYRGICQRTGKRVAVKKTTVLKTGRLEYNTLRKLNNLDGPYKEFVIKCLDYGEINDAFYIVLPLMRSSLCDILDADKVVGDRTILTPKHMKLLCFQLLGALEHLDRLHFIHTDLKPENVLITPCEEVVRTKGGERWKELVSPSFVLCDLNSVKVKNCEDCRKGLLIQTSNYRAPEVVLGLPFDEKVDVFSVGAIIGECLHGELIFYPNEKEPDNPTEDEKLTHLEQIEHVAGLVPERMFQKTNVDAFKGRFRYSAPIFEEPHLVPHWKWRMTKDKDYYHLSAMTTLLMTTDPLLRPSATTVLEFDCFDELRTVLNIKKNSETASVKRPLTKRNPVRDD